MCNKKIKVAYLYNPVSGLGKNRPLKCLDMLQNIADQGVEISSFETKEGNVAGQAHNISDLRFECIIVSGGDGTVMDVINGICRSEMNVSLGIIPLGTGNDLARSLGLFKSFKSNPKKYINNLLNSIRFGRLGKLNVLLLNNSLRFTNYLSIGFCAKVIADFNSIRALPFNNWLIYFYAILKNMFCCVKNGLSLNITLSDGTLKKINIATCKDLVILNISSYAGGIVKFENIHTDSDIFSVFIIKNIFGVFLFLLNSLFPSLCNSFSFLRLHVFEVKKIMITLSDEEYIQIGGEELLVKDTGNSLDIRSIEFIDIIN